MQPTVPLLGWCLQWMQLKQLVCVVGPNPYSPMTTESGIQNVNRRTRVCLFIAIRSILFLDDNTLSLQQWYTTPCHRVCPLTQNSLLIEETAHSCSHHFEGSLSSLWGFALTLWLDGADLCLFFRVLLSLAIPLYTRPTPNLLVSQTGAVLQYRNQTLFGNTLQRYVPFLVAASGR